jgi:hypothetical protein
MYTPGMSVMSLLLKNSYQSRGVEISFYRKRKCFSFLSFPKKEFLSLRRFQQPEEDTSGLGR